jgi:hypothetical protein
VIFNYNVYNTPNIGDVASLPMRYFRENALMRDVRIPLPAGQLSKFDVLIFGGGGMADEFWADKLKDYLKRPREHKVILWGIGHNASSMDKNYPEWLNSADLVGVRDFNREFSWVPCASCMSPHIERYASTSPLAQYVVYYHHALGPFPSYGYPRANNYTMRTMEEALAFLSCGETVVTNSYHGAYWGVLLGRKVVCHPICSKFLEMKHPPAFADFNRDWRGVVPKRHRFALQECRDANIAFWHRAKELIRSTGEHLLHGRDR